MNRAAALRRAAFSRTGRQSTAFTVLSISASLFGALATLILAGSFSTDTFGAFTLSKSLLLLVASLFEFGIFFPAARLAARADTQIERREWIGATLVTYVPVGCLYVITVALLSFGVDSVFNVDAGHALLVTAPLAFAYPFSLVALSISQGSGRAYLQPLLASVAGAIILAGLITIDGIAGHELSLTGILALRGGAFILASLMIVLIAKPLVHDLKAKWAKIWAETRRWGMNAYLGRVMSVGTYNIDVLMIGAFSDGQQLASYGLALAASALIGVPAVGIGTALYPKMAREGRLDLRPIRMLIAWGLAATAAGSAIGALVIGRFINPDLADAAVLLIPLGLGATLRAITSVLNSYLSARAQGKYLRNTSLILFAANVTLNPILIIPFGAMGAAIASLIAMTLNLAGYVYYIRRLG